MTFGKNIRARRLDRKLSLRSVAQAIGVDVAYLSRVEKDAVPPSLSLLDGLSKSLDLPIEEVYLLAGRVPPSLQLLVNSDPERVPAALAGLAELVVAEPKAAYGAPILARRGMTAIEDGFPFEYLSDVAEIESWRKEIYRPVYHQHKWWAKRLGSVFRAAILGATMPKGSAIMDLFYEPVKLPAPVVFDPFMGSGTIVGEAHKLGCTAVGRDINPVAYRSVKIALSHVSKSKLKKLFIQLETDVAPQLSALYSTTDSDGREGAVLYYFWVKQLPCPTCAKPVDLFSSRIFARHAYPKKHPRVHASCPGCGEVVATTYNAIQTACPSCKLTFDPQVGAAKRTKAECGACGTLFPIAKTARKRGEPPGHRLYAKLVLRHDGEKEYLRATDADLAAFRKARERLETLDPPLPKVPISDGYNTRQVLNYGYCTWDQMFNARQLLGLSLLMQGIKNLPACPERDALMLLFSGVLEFNNMFASYKGEGTGAVRHMFSHHILKPERVPIEANLWGTPKSSGSFSTLFRSRLLRALDYKASPFEVAVERNGKRLKGRKVHGLSLPMGATVLDAVPEGGLPPGSVYVSCGDSSRTDLPDRSVDAVITDPPFFDNVHYSELADFFYVWQQLYFEAPVGYEDFTTRREGEVQDTDAVLFSEKLRAVFIECHRVLKDDGLLVFSYHHSRDDGWRSVADAILGSGFRIVQSQPVKAEMSVATPKSQAKSPIDVDVLLVCRKSSSDRRQKMKVEQAIRRAEDAAKAKVERFASLGRKLSENDVKVVLLSQALVELSAGRGATEVGKLFEESLPYLTRVIPQIHKIAMVTAENAERKIAEHQVSQQMSLALG